MPNVLMLHFVGQQACSALGFRYQTHTHTHSYSQWYTHRHTNCWAAAVDAGSDQAINGQKMNVALVKWHPHMAHTCTRWPLHTDTHTCTYRGTYTHDNMRIRINKFTRTKLQHFGISNWSCVYISMHTSMRVCVCSVCVCGYLSEVCVRVNCQLRCLAKDIQLGAAV